jgi:uncharacterized protein (TIGR03435 family)
MKPVVLVLLSAMAVMLPASQTAAQKLAFEVASIKPASACPPITAASRAVPARGRISVCAPLNVTIQRAYFYYGRDVPSLDAEIEGGPSWLSSDRYEINAVAEGDATQEQMLGKMMQQLLEDRFKLKAHYESRDIPVYALTIAKGGPKLKNFEEGSCVPLEESVNRISQVTPPCGVIVIYPHDNNLRLDAHKLTVSNFAGRAKGVLRLDRPVIDKTGIDGVFSFHLEFAPSQTVLGGPSNAPSIFTAIQEQLGLKLEPTKGSEEVLVIDSVQRPSEN